MWCPRWWVTVPLGVLGSVALTVGAARAEAQGNVGGRVALLERAGPRTADLAHAVVWLETLDGDGGGASADGAPAEIVMESREFRPAVRVVAPGSAVTFPNYDPFRHNVFSNTGPGVFDLGLYGRSERREARVARAGVYPVFCNIHSRMVAYVLAVDSRWHAQAGDDGRWSIADVPAGRYRLHAWHDRGGEHVRELDVPAGGVADADVQLDARGWRPTRHRNKYGQDYPPEVRDRY